MGFLAKLIKTVSPTEPVSREFTLRSPIAGKVITMERIPDEVFSEGILGKCCGIEPEGGEIFSPCDGVVTQISDTSHAIGIKTDIGADILIHVGIDTFEMNGDGFDVKVKMGDMIEKGQFIMSMDREKIRSAGHPTIVVVAITNSDSFDEIKFTDESEVRVGSMLFKVEVKESDRKA